MGHFLRNSSTAVTSTRMTRSDAPGTLDLSIEMLSMTPTAMPPAKASGSDTSPPISVATNALVNSRNVPTLTSCRRDQDSGDARKCGADNPVELRDGVGPYAGEPRRVGIVGNGPNRDAEACSMEEPAEQQRRPHGDRQHRKLLVRDAHVADLDRLVREDEPRGLRIDAVEVQ